MRPVPLALALALAGVCAGCMDTRTASLGVEALPTPAIESDAARAPVGRDAGEARIVPPDLDAAERADAAGARDADGPGLEPDADAGSGSLDATARAHDGGSAPPELDAGGAPPDAGASDASVVPPDAARDATRVDAKVPVNPLCIAEPWHCQ